MSHVPPGPHEAYRAHRRWVRAGQVAMGLALVIAGVHVVGHLTASPSGLTDLVAGYPAAGVLFLVGAMLAGRADPAAR